MNIEQINIKNFRNIDCININLNKNINLFIGNNGEGKTNILESIYVLGLTKPHNKFEEKELIKFNMDFTKIIGKINNNNKIIKQEVIITKCDKTVKINSNKILKISDYISNLNIIMFTPDDLEIIKKSPSFRRNILNIDLCQLYVDYTNTLNEYNKILKMRNEYLKNEYTIDYNYLNILTDKLIEKIIKIMNYRKDFINNINNKINKIYFKIAGIKNLKIVYEPSILLNDLNFETIKNKYNLSLQNDINNHQTMIGPHRDDFSFYVENINMKNFGSQGQQRLIILSLKLAEVDIFKKQTNTYPIMLLDDVFSEIDSLKQNKLLSYIKSNIQYIITTTDLNNIKLKKSDNVSVFYVKRGAIVERKGSYGKKL